MYFLLTVACPLISVKPESIIAGAGKGFDSVSALVTTVVTALETFINIWKENIHMYVYNINIYI